MLGAAFCSFAGAMWRRQVSGYVPAKVDIVKLFHELGVVWNCGPGGHRGGSPGMVHPKEELLLGSEEERYDLVHGLGYGNDVGAILEDGRRRQHREVVRGDSHRVHGPNHTVQEDGPTF